MGDTVRQLSGPKSVFRGKLRARPVVATFTPEGHAALARGLARHDGMSRSDYLEMLVRRADKRKAGTAT